MEGSIRCLSPSLSSLQMAQAFRQYKLTGFVCVCMYAYIFIYLQASFLIYIAGSVSIYISLETLQ